MNILESGLRLGGFVYLSAQEYRNLLSIRQKGAYRIMCLGESTTQNQYPPFLGEILNRQNNIKVKFSIIDKGMTGISTSGILANLEALLQQYRPDMVIVMMGINDLGRHMPQESFSTSKVTLFLRTFKTYNLLRILWLHIITKTKEIRAHYLRQDGQSSKKSQSSFSKTLQKEAYAGKTKTSLSSSQNPEITKQDPGSDITFFNQGKLYRIEDHFLQAEESFKKAIRLNPRYSMAYVGLGLLYQSKDKFSEAEAAFKKAIEINPEEWSAYIDLGGIYQEQDELALAEELYKRALQLNIKHNRLYGAIGTLYQESGNSELANEYFKKAEELRSKWHDPIVTNNYLKLKEMLDIKGIRLVCVQYPMLSIESLKKIFNDREGIIFVDNEKNFKQAVKNGSYKEYFSDSFAGDFGHCTEKGNRLLAENIANTILKEVFNK